VVDVERNIANGPEVAMKRDTVEAGKLFETCAGSGVNGIAFGNVPKLNNGRRHLLESTGGKRACQLQCSFWYRATANSCLPPSAFEIAV
jgi:hypothetical protein